MRFYRSSAFTESRFEYHPKIYDEVGFTIDGEMKICLISSKQIWLTSKVLTKLGFTDETYYEFCKYCFSYDPVRPHDRPTMGHIKSLCYREGDTDAAKSFIIGMDKLIKFKEHGTLFSLTSKELVLFKKITGKKDYSPFEMLSNDFGVTIGRYEGTFIAGIDPAQTRYIIIKTDRIRI